MLVTIISSLINRAHLTTLMDLSFVANCTSKVKSQINVFIFICLILIFILINIMQSDYFRYYCTYIIKLKRWYFPDYVFYLDIFLINFILIFKKII